MNKTAGLLLTTVRNAVNGCQILDVYDVTELVNQLKGLVSPPSGEDDEMYLSVI